MNRKGIHHGGRDWVLGFQAIEGTNWPDLRNKIETLTRNWNMSGEGWGDLSVCVVHNDEQALANLRDELEGEFELIFEEEDEELEPCWSCDKWKVNEENAVGAVDEYDYTAFICPDCKNLPKCQEHLYKTEHPTTWMRPLERDSILRFGPGFFLALTKAGSKSLRVAVAN